MKPFLLFLGLIPILLTSCASSGHGWISANSPVYSGKAGPNGELHPENVEAPNRSDVQVASNKTSDTAPKYHHYDGGPAHGYVSGTQTPHLKNIQDARSSSVAHPKSGNYDVSVSSETLPLVTQK